MRATLAFNPRPDAVLNVAEQAWKSFYSMQMEKHQNISTFAHSIEVAEQKINDARKRCTTETVFCTEQVAVAKLLHSLTPAFDPIKIQYDTHVRNKTTPSWKRALNMLLRLESRLVAKAGKRFPFMDLPQELRETVYPFLFPYRVEIILPTYTPGVDPEFIPALAQQGNQMLRLECILAMLKSAAFRVTSIEDAENMKLWLASIDLTPLQRFNGSAALKNGFDCVGTLFFSDINRVVIHCIQGYSKRAYTYDYKYTSENPSPWADDLELTRMCKNLHSVELELMLPPNVLDGLKNGREVDEMIQEAPSATYQITKVLELEGIRVLHLRFFNALWESAYLTRKQESVIIDWLSEEFQKLGQSIQIKSEWEFWAEDWS